MTAGVAQSKYAFFLEHHPVALASFNQKPGAFGDDNPLYQELRTVYDWMAQSRGAQRISCRRFKQRLPEIHKKFPQLAKCFSSMDYNSDGWLDWEEFLTFCLTDKRMHAMMNRARLMTVYGVDAKGGKSFKDINDPRHMCETSASPPMLPWETAHVVEWRIEDLIVSRKGAPCMYGGIPIRPGKSIVSPPFRAAGVCGSLRFWPAGYYSDPQRRSKACLAPGAEDFAAATFDGGIRPLRAPSHDAWGCLGVSDLPNGTRLKLRFFIGSKKSEVRDCAWREGVHASQLWSPPDKEPPPEINVGETLVVGIEILRNIDGDHWGVKPRSAAAEMYRHNKRPALPDSTLVSGSSLLGRAQEMQVQQPRLPKVRSLPQLTYGRPV
mmetsp:Transcript_21081/g.60961  ORF Transcript_21081/g.60961 Transcript_21081/m.60961 type:complete len:380 (-) Transcript_21081:46-1185(-)